MSNGHYAPKITTEYPYKSPSLAKVYAELGQMKDTTPTFNKSRRFIVNGLHQIF